MWKLCLFSAVHAVILDHGHPVAGATVERSFVWDWKSERGQESIVTHADGRVEFAPIWRSSALASIVPHEPSIGQRIVIKVGDRSYDAWVANKGEYGENGELRGKPIDLVCDLATEPTEMDRFFGICRLRTSKP